MKKNWFKLTRNIGFCLCLAAALASCDDNNNPIPDPDPTPEPTETLGAYIVNTGNSGSNDGSLQWFDLTTHKTGEDLYRAQNGQEIGDLQDLCIYGSKLYAISDASSKVEILDRNGKLVKSLPMNTQDEKPMHPRYATAGEGCVFFTAYDGTVSCLDTLTQEITGSVSVGNHPEALTYVDGKLFVNISGQPGDEYGGSGNQVAVVDAKTMTKLTGIEVVLNPYTQCLAGDDGYVYVVSTGNYAGSSYIPEDQWVYQTLQRIDPDTYEVEALCNASYIANAGGKMYILYSEYYLPDTRRCYVYDLATGEETDLSSISLDEFSSPGFIAVDPVTEDIYIGDQLYGALNTVSVYDKDGQFKHKFDTGMYTTNIRFVAE